MTRGLPIKLMQCRHGPMFVLMTDIYVGGALATLGEYSEGEVALLNDLLRPGDVVVEAGANMGVHTIPLARRVAPTGKVIAYEPQRALYAVMRGNLALNNLAHLVEAKLAAVDEREGALHVPAFDYAKKDNFGGFPDTLVAFTESSTKAVAHEVVPATTIDALRLPACALIKADVEGMEIAVIGGATETLERCRPIVYLEVAASRSRPILISLEAMGYRLWRHLPPLFSEDNYRGARENPWPGLVSVNVLGLPGEQSLPEETASRHSLRVIDDPFLDRL